MLFITERLSKYIFLNRRLRLNIRSLIMNLVTVLFILLLFTSNTYAKIIASSCSREDVLAAINSASTGDTVVIPAGECTWSEGITLTDKITVMGSGTDSTFISNTLSSGVPIFRLGKTGSRITNINFLTGTSIRSEGYGFRIDHCQFESAGITISRSSLDLENLIPTGVIDSNIFTISGRVGVVPNYGMNEIWASELDIGTEKAIYIEDNIFYRTGTGIANALDSNYGGSYVFRYNTIISSSTQGNSGLYLEAHSIQGGHRASRKWEIYGNHIENTGLSTYMPYRVRGGTGVIFYNRTLGNWTSHHIGFDNVRSFSLRTVSGQCDGSSLWDGNYDETGWPCRDQIGSGKDVSRWTWGPEPLKFTQTRKPAYVWLNQKEANAEITVSVLKGSENHIRPNRDYYEHNVAFDGSEGVGTGTLANRPATCTGGVAYWATNQDMTDISNYVGTNPIEPLDGILYKCVDTDTWEEYFTPYEYPHPLRRPASPKLEMKN